jgi:hypothetical protein
MPIPPLPFRRRLTPHLTAVQAGAAVRRNLGRSDARFSASFTRREWQLIAEVLDTEAHAGEDPHFAHRAGDLLDKVIAELPAVFDRPRSS